MRAVELKDRRNCVCHYRARQRKLSHALNWFFKQPRNRSDAILMDASPKRGRDSRLLNMPELARLPPYIVSSAHGNLQECQKNDHPVLNGLPRLPQSSLQNVTARLSSSFTVAKGNGRKGIAKFLCHDLGIRIAHAKGYERSHIAEYRLSNRQ